MKNQTENNSVTASNDLAQGQYSYNKKRNESSNNRSVIGGPLMNLSPNQDKMRQYNNSLTPSKSGKGQLILQS
jgi:hypothetical protein